METKSHQSAEDTTGRGIKSLYWKRSASRARLYRFSTDRNSGDGKRLILLWVLAYPLIINESIWAKLK